MIFKTLMGSVAAHYEPCFCQHISTLRDENRPGLDGVWHSGKVLVNPLSRGGLDLNINKDSLTRTRKGASCFPPRSPEHEDFHKTSITSVTVCVLLGSGAVFCLVWKLR